MRNPFGVPKTFDLEIPEPVGLPNSFEPEAPLSPPPAPPTERRTLVHPLTIHVLDVVDRTVPFLEFNKDFEPDEDEDLTRRHDYSRFCFRGRVDGTGSGNTPRSRTHPFGGPGGFGIAGDWGGRRAHGLLAPAGGMPLPHLQSVRRIPVRPRGGESMSPAPPICTGPMDGGLAPAAPLTSLATRSPSLAASVPPMVVGSAALVDTPAMPDSLAPTAVGSAAFGNTPPSGRATLHMQLSPCRLSFGLDEEEHEAPTDAALAPMGRGSPLAGEEISSASATELPVDLVAGPQGLKPLVMQRQVEETLNSSFSPVRTPFAIPLSPSKLLPHLAPTGGLGLELGPKTAEETLLSGLMATPTSSILGPRPAASAPVRRKKGIPPGFTPRRSARLCKNNGGMNMGPYHRAQTVLLRRMGVIQAEEQLSKEALDEYLKMFEGPLVPHHIKAIAALFDPDGVGFDEPAHEGFSAFSLPDVVEPCGA